MAEKIDPNTYDCGDYEKKLEEYLIKAKSVEAALKFPKIAL